MLTERTLCHLDLFAANGPGRPGAVKRPWRFPIKIHFVWARGAFKRQKWRFPARAVLYGSDDGGGDGGAAEGPAAG